MAESPNQKRLSTEQKAGFAFMLIFAFLAIGLGAIQMRTNIYGPFLSQHTEQVQGVVDAQAVFDETLRLQRIDTDHDGINDFEELNFYQTSPYLPDTDSDGISDDTEIKNGTDPLCPEGKDCALNTSILTNTGISEDDGALETPLLDAALQNSAVGGGTTTGTSPGLFDIGALLQDPTQLRAALLASGQVSAEELAAFNDDQLLDLAQHALKTQGTTQVVNGANTNNPSLVTQPTTPSQDVTPEQLEALLQKPEELRTLLMSTGKMSQAQLDQIDNATLISVTKDIIASAR
ncbi:MAG: IclR-like protein transcriptional regulator [Candidatus Magasanikbacteria bacterium GW2011_GWD2_43_18]|uniref:IclR-like protein transcriptional regulator n=1 Tax=Candidatus Magasanikbacteria bacterium GW2011_GWE2_42_7 TaxID=1619052 RepID=A0A0G1BHF6_9BACT|nr:MAG: IclR-like protein transcriptional regulator [Candidatus Magasanikbacteria bacterium GW2011_GWC2_42_27]KKS72614.1 MAG: IclR-like protein transcriptional regulator [Candidatus Magasanikbacteria bacterium GW2011_GWE2_42_7]KKT05114.1 MAG: IclR-like protein transcriptional regulator [Candidatus Magasanikbacteria bacterium GW2011_GWD2_43_18]KKT24593.1 MAG: IclR-like protein transcriptional regulator [Candidatus Magasanikbacteria bacterium GW2011_GWA2_43_9]HBB38080.1 hypothetical protein [Cand